MHLKCNISTPIVFKRPSPSVIDFRPYRSASFASDRPSSEGPALWLYSKASRTGRRGFESSRVEWSGVESSGAGSFWVNINLAKMASLSSPRFASPAGVSQINCNYNKQTLGGRAMQSECKSKSKWESRSGAVQCLQHFVIPLPILGLRYIHLMPLISLSNFCFYIHQTSGKRSLFAFDCFAKHVQWKMRAQNEWRSGKMWKNVEMARGNGNRNGNGNGWANENNIDWKLINCHSTGTCGCENS